MNENRKRILEMLAEGKISVDEASRLLTAIDAPSTPGHDGSDSQATRPPAKYLRVVVEPKDDAGPFSDRVNTRVPMALIRAGIKLTALIPSHATNGINEALKTGGVDVDVGNLKSEDLEQLVDALRDFEIDVEDDEEHVRVYVE